MAAKAVTPEPQGTGPIEVEPYIAADFKPVEYTPYQDRPVTPVAEKHKPATGTEEN